MYFPLRILFLMLLRKPLVTAIFAQRTMLECIGSEDSTALLALCEPTRLATARATNLTSLRGRLGDPECSLLKGEEEEEEEKVEGSSCSPLPVAPESWVPRDDPDPAVAEP